MRNLTFGLIIGLLLLVGTLLRVQETDWNKDKLYTTSGIKLTVKEMANDNAVRRFLQLQSDNGFRLQTHNDSSVFLNSTGYPLFLTVCYWAFGYETDPPMVPIQILQNILDLLTALILLATVQMLINNRFISLIVCAIYLIHPAIIRSSSNLSSETLFSFVNALFLFAFVLFFKSGAYSRTIGLASGVVFGISSLIQPRIFPYLLLFVGVAGLHCFFTRKKVYPYLLVILGCMLVLSPWLLRLLLTPDSRVNAALHYSEVLYIYNQH